MNEEGIQMCVITPVPSNFDEKSKFKVIRLKMPIRLGFNLNFFEPLILILKERPKLIHFSGPAIVDFILMPICKMLGYPVVITFHGQFNNKLVRVISNFIIPITYKSANLIIVETDRDRKYLINRHVEVYKIKKFIFNGVERSKFKCQNNREEYVNKSRPIRLIFIGGLSSSRPYKGYDLLIDMFIKIRNYDISPTPELTVVGDGDRLNEMRRKSDGIDYIHFKGRLDDNEMLNEICGSDMLILPSKSDGEGFGIVALEVLSCNKPVIVSKYAGIAELVSKYKVGMVYDPWDIDGAIKILIEINSNRELINFFKENINSMFDSENLSKDDSIRDTIKIYEEILDY
ncbi:MAG: glycosyltransferase family 4 protein [Caldisphaera sp.]